jgi:hypothetical protein
MKKEATLKHKRLKKTPMKKEATLKSKGFKRGPPIKKEAISQTENQEPSAHQSKLC